MIKKAVIDSISKNYITLLVGPEEKEFILSKDQISDSSEYQEGDWLEVKVKDDKVKIIKVDKEETENVKERIQKKLDRLRRRMDSDL